MLGPLEITADGRPLPVQGARARAVLAMLLVHANHVVAAGQLTGELWPGQPAGRAAESRAEALLACGRHRELIGELETLTAAHPLRERLWAQRMLALYRAGRQADALRAYRDLRAILVSELGIEPSPALRELEGRILSQDSALAPPAVGRVPGRGGVRSELEPPPTRYAVSDDGVHIAYQVLGDSEPDIVAVPGLISHLDLWWEDPYAARFFRKLASLGRLIMFDKRDTGLSDRAAGEDTLEQRIDDVRAVMRACRSERAVLFGYSEGGPMSILFAATYPERVSALILGGASARWPAAPGYPCGQQTEPLPGRAPARRALFRAAGRALALARRHRRDVHPDPGVPHRGQGHPRARRGARDHPAHSPNRARRERVAMTGTPAALTRDGTNR